MNRIIIKIMVLVSMLVSGLGGHSWAAPLHIPNEGLSLVGEAKQAYISNEMNTLFQNLESANAAFELPDAWTKQTLYFQAVPVEYFSHEMEQGDRVILQLHGGGYVAGMTDYHRTLALKQATLMGAREIYSVDYRLTPAYVYPAALEDAVTVYKGLLSQGIQGKDIIVIGDSAGGNLGIALSIYLRDHQIELPGAMLLASPWADFEHKQHTSRTENERKDQVLGIGTPLYEAVVKPVYAGELDVLDPKVSVLYADLKGLPPTLIQIGGNELFLTEGEALATNMAAVGNIVSMTIYPAMPHDFALLLPDMQESIDSLLEMRDFVNRYMK